MKFDFLKRMSDWWNDLMSPWRSNILYFFINEKGDLQLLSAYDDKYNFEVIECDEMVAKILFSFPSDDFQKWLRELNSGSKLSHAFSVIYFVSATGKIKFDVNSFEATSWGLRVF